MPDLTFDRFKAIVADQLAWRPSRLTPEAFIREDLTRTPLDPGELIMAFEESTRWRSPTRTRRRSGR